MMYGLQAEGLRAKPLFANLEWDGWRNQARRTRRCFWRKWDEVIGHEPANTG